VNVFSISVIRNRRIGGGGMLSVPEEWRAYSKLTQGTVNINQHPVDKINGQGQFQNVHQVLIPCPTGRSPFRASRPIITSWAQYWKRTKFSFLIIVIVILVIVFLGRLYVKHVRQLRLDEYINQVTQFNLL